MWVFGEVVVTALYTNGLTVWFAMGKLFSMTIGVTLTSFIQIAPS